MKNFFKKLSFVLAVAMVLTTLTPATASAASKNFIRLNGSSKAITSVTAWIGGVTRNLDYSINGKTSGVKGTWKSSNTSIVKVNKNTGVLTPVANGTAKVTFTASTGTTASVTVKVRTRAAALYVYDAAEYAAGTKTKLNDGTVELKVGETKDLKVTMPISKAATAAGGKAATYFSYGSSSDDSVVAVTKNSGERSYTLTAKAAGEATVTIVANQTTEANVRNNKYFKEATVTVKVADGLAISTLEATKVNILTATFGSPVDTDDVTVSVTKGSNAVEATVAWNADKTVATITTTAKMTAGTYTVKAVSKADASATTEKSVDIVSQYVKEIQILNDVALTGTGTVEGKENVDAAVAYVYYKVVDQYGEDLTASTSIEWNTSAGKPTVKRNEGKLIVSRSDSKAFTYGEQLFVSGVYKTGVNVNATLTIGSAQSLDSIDMVGFVKKNTNEIVDTLPVDFKEGEYYLLYKAVDKNGNALEVTGSHTTSDVTFISDNVMLIKELKHADSTMVVNGVSYFAAEVVPGSFVSKGGEVNITAIASKTGTASKHNYVIGENKLLTSFTMSPPTESVVADGETVEIPFTALDQNGETITNFVTLADNLNKLTFSVSDGTVTLKEKNDGTAVLEYTDKTMNWTDSQTTDGIDRKVSITSVVVGGDSNNLMLDISDKARPDAIKAVAINSVMLEGATSSAILSSFTFLDQYGRDMTEKFGSGNNDNGFFAATANKNNGSTMSGSDFKDYVYGIKMEYKGSDDALATPGAIISSVSPSAILTSSATYGNTAITFTIAAKTKTALSGNVFTFAIVKKDITKESSEYETVSTTLNKSFTVVDITQVKNFTITALEKQYVKTAYSEEQTGNEITPITGSAASAEILPGYTQAVVVKGTYNGEEVTVPTQYYSVAGTKLSTTTGAIAALGENVINTVSTAAIKWSDLYDATTARYTRKDTTDVVTAKIYAIYQADGTKVDDGIEIRDTASTVVTISDAAPVLSKIQTVDTCTIKPTDTATSSGAIMAAIVKETAKTTYLDQYGKEVTPDTVTYKISKVEEAAAYADNNFNVSGNDSTDVEVVGAERGDTFVLTITAKHKGVTLTKDVTITVGADTNAKLTQSKNYYTDGTIETGNKKNDLKDILDEQRLNGLK